MGIKLIAFDLDGTLLDKQKRISAENLAALDAASDKGILTVPASGRFYPGIPAELKKSYGRYYILGNGMTVYDAVKDVKLCSYEISLAETLRFFEYADSIGSFYDCYADDNVYISQPIYDRLPELIVDKNFLNMMYSLRKPVDDLRAWLIARNKPVQKILFYFTDPEQRLEQLELMPKLYPEYNITTSIYCNAEINSKNADKGKALELLCRKLGISTDETMVLGDELNDIGMFRTAGLRVAMANANDALKAEADYITGSCDESGVAQAIWKYAL